MTVVGSCCGNVARLMKGRRREKSRPVSTAPWGTSFHAPSSLMDALSFWTGRSEMRWGAGSDLLFVGSITVESRMLNDCPLNRLGCFHVGCALFIEKTRPP